MRRPNNRIESDGKNGGGADAARLLARTSCAAFGDCNFLEIGYFERIKNTSNAQMEAIMDTYFAPPERVNEKELATEINIVSGNPVISGLLHSISGLLAVLDEHRQIVALNDSLLKVMGFADSAEVLGLRQGEALSCIHAHDEPAGCGTTKYCSTCGAAIAIVSSLGQNTPIERP